MTHSHPHHHHDEEPMTGPLEIAGDRVAFTSVGIDIGSTTTHLIFCAIELERQRDRLSSQFRVASREVLYESPILLTPYRDGTMIDVEQVGAFIEWSYRAAGLSPSQVDAGAVIETGEAAKKENAEAIGALFSAQAGRFVCATAGPHLEARIAAYGSGSVKRSLEHPGQAILNLDVGGGSTKFALVLDGRVVATAAIEVGARLLALDSAGRIVRMENPARPVLDALGLCHNLGDVLEPEERVAFARELAKAIRDFLNGSLDSRVVRALAITPCLPRTPAPAGVIVSGGVAEFVYGREHGDYGDLGRLLSGELVALLGELGLPLEPGEQGIRSTVLGASQYTVHVSGTSLFISHPDVLPLRNMPAISIRLPGPELRVEEVAAALAAELEPVDNQPGPVALAIEWGCLPSYDNVAALGEAVWRKRLRLGSPVILLFDADVARLAGHIVAERLEPRTAVISLDGIRLEGLNYVDLGAPVGPAGVVPVVVKTLLFRPEALS